MSARRLLFGHPIRAALVAIAIGVALYAAWYLGSPLFLRTQANEALPALSEPMPDASASSDPSPRVLARGQLGYVDPLHHGTGEVRVLEVGGQRYLRFEDVVITNAPDIHIYLSEDVGGAWSEPRSLYLGTLRATDGSFNYEIPREADPSRYRSVVVWCRQFAVLITWADLR